MNSKILNIILVLLIGILIFQNQAPSTQQDINTDNPLSIQTEKKTYPLQKTVGVKINNNTNKNIQLTFKCPNSPFQAVQIQNGTTTPIETSTKLNCENNNVKNGFTSMIPPQNKRVLKLDYHSNQLFENLGSYKLQASYEYEGKRYQLETNEFEIESPGFFRSLWMNFFYKPVYNALIALIGLMPGQNLGLGIIILTLIIRTLLFHPNQKALSGQKKMQEIQPKLEAIRKKHKDNQQLMAMETLKVWQEAKVNPFSSCLPMLIQFPILIAIFYVVQAGINPDKQVLLYNFISQIQLDQIQTQFLGLLYMTERNLFVLPIIVGLLQFIQLKTAMPSMSGTSSGNSTNQAIQKNMVYFMPALIAVFTASLPSGVGLYWATSTLFGIGQQTYINRKK